jgi:hypothetical protein
MGHFVFPRSTSVRVLLPITQNLPFRYQPIDACFGRLKSSYLGSKADTDRCYFPPSKSARSFRPSTSCASGKRPARLRTPDSIGGSAIAKCERSSSKSGQRGLAFVDPTRAPQSCGPRRTRPGHAEDGGDRWVKQQATYVGVGYQSSAKPPLETAIGDVEDRALATDAQTACPDQDVDDGLRQFRLCDLLRNHGVQAGQRRPLPELGQVVKQGLSVGDDLEQLTVKIFPPAIRVPLAP